MSPQPLPDAAPEGRGCCSSPASVEGQSNVGHGIYLGCVTKLRNRWKWFWRKQSLSVETDLPPNECENVLQAAATSPIGAFGPNLFVTADADWIRQLRWNGIVLQGRLSGGTFDLYSLRVGDGAGPNSRSGWQVHYKGHFEPTIGSTKLVGHLSIPAKTRYSFCIFFLVAFAAMATIATGFVPGAVIGLVMALFLFTMAGLSLAWADEWDELPTLVLDVLDGHVTKGG